MNAQPPPASVPPLDGLLVIDTSTSFGAVGLWRDGGLARSLSWRSRNNHTAELLPAIDALLRADGASPAAIGGVIVTVGPGGFSAVRTGLGVAKGLALGGSLPVAGVGSLDASAYPYRDACERVCAALPAGRDAVAWAAFGYAAPVSEEGATEGASETEGAWSALTDAAVSPVEEFLAALPEGTLLCGEAAALVRGRLRESGRAPHIVAVSAPLDRLNGAGELGAAALDSERTSAAAIEPRYLRPPRITRSAKTPG